MELSGHNPMVNKGTSVMFIEIIMRVTFKRLG